MAIDCATVPIRPRQAWIRTFFDYWAGSDPRRQLIDEVGAFPDERLRDIGLERCDIATRFDSEMSRIDLQRLGRIGLC